MIRKLKMPNIIKILTKELMNYKQLKPLNNCCKVNKIKLTVITSYQISNRKHLMDD